MNADLSVLDKPDVLAFIEAHAVKLRFTALPEDVRDHREARHFYLYVERRSPGKWAVTEEFGEVLSRTGKWRYESNPSSRTEKFIEVTRFPLVEAIRLAVKEAKNIEMNRYTVDTITEQIRKWQAEDSEA